MTSTGFLDRRSPSLYSLSSDDDSELPSVSIDGPQNPAPGSITTSESTCDDTEEAIVAHVLAESLQSQERVSERFA